MATCRCTGCASGCAVHRRDVSCCGWPSGKHKHMKAAELCYWCFQESGLQVPTPDAGAVGAQRLGFASGQPLGPAISTCICTGCASGCADHRQDVSCCGWPQGRHRQEKAARLCHYCFGYAIPVATAPIDAIPTTMPVPASVPDDPAGSALQRHVPTKGQEEKEAHSFAVPVLQEAPASSSHCVAVPMLADAPAFVAAIFGHHGTQHSLVGAGRQEKTSFTKKTNKIRRQQNPAGSEVNT